MVLSKISEVYFVDNFLNNIDQPYQLSLEGSWRVLAENFCILNTYDIDLFWNKYSKKEFRHDKYIFHRNKQINFAEWLVMHNNFPKETPEYIINKEIKKMLYLRRLKKIILFPIGLLSVFSMKEFINFLK